MNAAHDSTNSARAALLTGAGRGAVAVIRVWGPGATAAVARCFQPASGKPVADLPTQRIAFGRWSADVSPSAGEELVVCRRAAEDWEVHCHGGPAAVAAVLESLGAGGCTVVDWHISLAAESATASIAEAFAVLAGTTTTRAAVIALEQTTGLFDAALAEIERLRSAGDAAEVQRRIDRLRELIPVGRHLAEPFVVAIVGRPNVGKSSLLNALLGYRRAIVFDEPGTTRDVVTGATALDGWPIELCDTAGLRDAGDELETAGMERTRRRAADADLVLLIADHSQPWTEADEALRREYPHALVVHNKHDLPAADASRPPGIAVSAANGVGLDELSSQIVAGLIPNPPQPGEAVPVSDRQARLVQAFRP